MPHKTSERQSIGGFSANDMTGGTLGIAPSILVGYQHPDSASRLDGGATAEPYELCPPVQ